jgi:hypothetical protein
MKMSKYKKKTNIRKTCFLKKIKNYRFATSIIKKLEKISIMPFLH